MTERGRLSPTSRVNIAKLTKGGLLIDRLVQAIIASMRWPHNKKLLEEFAESRKILQRHTTKLETKAGTYKPVKGYSVGRKPGKRNNGPGRGYSIRQIESGRYMVQCTIRGFMRGKSLGTVDTPEEADELGAREVALLRNGKA